MTAPFDPSTLSPEDLAAAKAEASRREREERSAILATLTDLDDATLAATVKDFEEKYDLSDSECEWLGSTGERDHDQGERSRCVACAGRAILRRRQHEAEKLLPGADPTNSSRSGSASDLRVGDVVRHVLAPGSDNFEYVEAIKVHHCPVPLPSGRTIEVTWRRTNDPTALSFMAAYYSDERIRHIGRHLPRAKVTEG